MLFFHTHTSTSPHLHQTYLLLVCLIPTILLRPTTSQLSFDYLSFKENDDTIELIRDAHHDHNTLQVSNYSRYSIGRVIYQESIHLWDKKSGNVADFSTNFSFIIDSPNKTHHGDGITFFLAVPDFPLPNEIDGGSIGLVSRNDMEDKTYLDEYPFVAVEFDTHVNDYWDPAYEHVAINVKSMSSPHTTEWFNIKDGRMYNASITFNSSTNNLSVAFTGYQNDTVIHQYIFCTVDLKKYLPEFVEIGLSSATGYDYEIHTLVSWGFSLSYKPTGDEGKRSEGTLVKRLSIGAVGVLIVAILGLTWVIVSKMKKKRRSRVQDVLAYNMDNNDQFKRVNGPETFNYKELALSTSDSLTKENKV